MTPVARLVLTVTAGLTLSGCGVIPSFPDLWPFGDDDPVPYQAPAQNQAQPNQAPQNQAPPDQAAQAQQAAAGGGNAPEVEREIDLAALPAPANGLTPAAPGAFVYIVTPADGATVTNPVRVIFGLDRMGVAPISSDHQYTGHHHLLIDTQLPPLDRPIPIDVNHQHFSGGQTETTLNLPVGEHTLQLLFGDHNHTPHQPPLYSRPVTIYVQ